MELAAVLPAQMMQHHEFAYQNGLLLIEYVHTDWRMIQASEIDFTSYIRIAKAERSIFSMSLNFRNLCAHYNPTKDEKGSPLEVFSLKTEQNAIPPQKYLLKNQRYARH